MHTQGHTHTNIEQTKANIISTLKQLHKANVRMGGCLQVNCIKLNSWTEPPYFPFQAMVDMHRKTANKKVKLQQTSKINLIWLFRDILNIFCKMNKVNEYLVFENDNKNCLVIFSHQAFTMTQRQKYQFRVLDASTILYLKLFNYNNQETITT